MTTRAFDGVVVELDTTIIKKPIESFPAGQRISDCIGQAIPRRDPIELASCQLFVVWTSGNDLARRVACLACAGWLRMIALIA
jgi:hypothetical protein